jgi:hypothetical protein
MMILLQLLLSLALAADVAPRERSIPIRVFDAEVEDVYHALPGGSQLSFVTAGPGKWSVEIRQRVAGAAQRAEGEVVVLGNGKHQIMRIALRAKADIGTRVDDAQGGVVTEAERATITVPATGEFLVLQTQQGSRDVLVRLFNDADPPPAVAAAAPPVTPIASTPFVAPNRPKQTKRRPPSPDSRAWLAGLSMGLGIPARGSKAVGYLGADVRTLVYRKLVSVGGSAGWYRIAVDETITVADPHLGHTNIQAKWTTDVFPVVARGLVHLPLRLGPALPIAGAGLGLFIARRTEGGASLTKVGVGPELLAGAEMDLERLGKAGANLTWAEARMHMGNLGPDGQPVRETVAHTRLNLSWIYTF